jgi:hypothetical protein
LTSTSGTFRFREAGVFKVCYKTADNAAFVDVGTDTFQVFAVPPTAYTFNGNTTQSVEAITLTFHGGQCLDTRGNGIGDRAKVVDFYEGCTGAAAAGSFEVTDLGPEESKNLVVSTANVGTFQVANVYTVCYKQAASNTYAVVGEEYIVFDPSGTSAGGVHVKVLGQSGKITIGANEDPSSDPNKVTVTMDGIYERNVAGALVGSKGLSNTGKHSRNTFANTNFAVGPLMPALLGEGTVRAASLEFESNLHKTSQVRITTYLVQKGGVVKPYPNATESFTVRVGSMKFNIELIDWVFCGDVDASCKAGEVGAFVDVDVEIKGKGSTASSSVDVGVPSFELGGGMSVDLSTQVQLDGTWHDMPEGYPKLRTVGSKQIFTFRFPKFSSLAKYDPVVQGAEVTPSDPTSFTLPNNDDAAVPRAVQAGEPFDIAFWNGVGLSSKTYDEGGDSAKIVRAADESCADVASGITASSDLGPGNQDGLDSVHATFQVPASQVDTQYKVCYRRNGESGYSDVGSSAGFKVVATPPTPPEAVSSPSPSEAIRSPAPSSGGDEAFLKSTSPSSAGEEQGDESSGTGQTTKLYLHQRLVLGGISLENAVEKKSDLATAIAKSLGIAPNRVTVTAVALASPTGGGDRRFLFSSSDRISVSYVVASSSAEEEKAAFSKMALLAAGDDSGTTLLISSIADTLGLDVASIKVVEASKSVPSSESTPTAEVLNAMVSGGDSSPSPDAKKELVGPTNDDSDNDEDEGLSAVLIVVIIGAAVVVLGGLGMVVRRRSAPDTTMGKKKKGDAVLLADDQYPDPNNTRLPNHSVIMQYDNNPGARSGRVTASV